MEISNTLSTTKPNNYICSTQSRSADEMILGTAPKIKTWLLLEYNGAWGSKAFNESDIDDKIKTHINRFLYNTPKSRLLLIKKGGKQLKSPLSFYIALSEKSPPVLYKFRLDDYKDLLKIDLQEINANNLTHENNISDGKLFLVCTNGKRDQCCAKFGVNAYIALKDSEFGSTAWQSTHLSGHRFAGNMVCFPHGYYFGRVENNDSITIAEKYSQGKLVLRKLRGRSGYTKIEQAAEGLLRKKINENRIEQLSIVGSEENHDGIWRVNFVDEESNQTHEVMVKKEDLGLSIFASCVGEKVSVVNGFTLMDHQIGYVLS